MWLVFRAGFPQQSWNRLMNPESHKIMLLYFQFCRLDDVYSYCSNSHGLYKGRDIRIWLFRITVLVHNNLLPFRNSYAQPDSFSPQTWCILAVLQCPHLITLLTKSDKGITPKIFKREKTSSSMYNSYKANKWVLSSTQTLKEYLP